MGDTARRRIGGYIWNEHLNEIKRRMDAIRREVELINSGADVSTGMLNIVLATVDVDGSLTTLESIARGNAKPAAGG